MINGYGQKLDRIELRERDRLPSWGEDNKEMKWGSGGYLTGVLM